MTIRPRLKADAPDRLDSREGIRSSAPVAQSTAKPAAKIGFNENNPQIPAWLSSRNRSGPPEVANRNVHESGATGADKKQARREWLYDWDSTPAMAPAVDGKQRRRLFLPRNSAAAAGRGRPVARRLIASAACLALVAAIGGGFLLFSGQGFKPTAPVVTPVKQKKAPAVAERTAKPAGLQQATAAEPGAPTRAVANAPAGVNEAQKSAALPARNKATAVATPPSPDSARWASNVVPPDRALSNAHGGKPASVTQSLAAFAPASVDAKPETAMKPARNDAKPAVEVKSASLTPTPNADDAETSSIPNDKNAAEKGRSTLEDVVRSGASKPIERGGRHAVVTTATNLRAGPENHSHVLIVVPARASVELFSCDQWCKVAYRGHEGYIYKEFVSRSGRVHAPVAARRAPAEKKRVASTDSGKLIGGAVVDSGASKGSAAQPAATPAPSSSPAQPAAPLPPTMGHDRH